MLSPDVQLRGRSGASGGERKLRCENTGVCFYVLLGDNWLRSDRGLFSGSDEVIILIRGVKYSSANKEGST